MKMRTVLQLISPPRPTLILSLVLLLATGLISLANPFFAGQIAAHILGEPGGYFQNILSLLMLWAGVIILRGVLSFASAYVTGSAAETVLSGLRGRLYEHLQLLPVSYFDERKRGGILSILTSDAAIISNFVTGTLIRVMPLTLTFAGAAAMMLWLNPLIGLAALVLLPVYVLVMKIITRKIRPLSRQWVDAYSDMMALAEENIGLLPAIKSYTREKQEYHRFRETNDFLLQLSRRQLLIHTLIPPAITLLASGGLLMLIWLGYRSITQNTMTPAELVSLVFYAMLLIQPLSELANVYGELQKTRGASERILDFLDQQREPEDAGLPALPPVTGGIRIRDISFNYPSSPDQWIFDGLSLDIPAGETIAIVGKNGAGKSTFAHLLMRLIDPVTGNIFIDGHNIRDVSIPSVRSQIGLVAQHTLLLNGTVGENIGWGRVLASRSEIERAAKAACAHDFIVKLANGYDTLVGDQGLKLSGGQRQRLSLARALLKDPPILILDEATSMFDPAGEHLFLQDCEAVFSHRTVILITHRPASLAVADRVLLLENGTFRKITDIDHYLKTGEVTPADPLGSEYEGFGYVTEGLPGGS